MGQFFKKLLKIAGKILVIVLVICLGIIGCILVGMATQVIAEAFFNLTRPIFELIGWLLIILLLILMSLKFH